MPKVSQLHAAGSEDAQRPDLDGTQFAPFTVKGKQEEHFRHTVKQADADTEQAESKT